MLNDSLWSFHTCWQVFYIHKQCITCCLWKSVCMHITISTNTHTCTHFSPIVFINYSCHFYCLLSGFLNFCLKLWIAGSWGLVSPGLGCCCFLLCCCHLLFITNVSTYTCSLLLRSGHYIWSFHNDFSIYLAASSHLFCFVFRTWEICWSHQDALRYKELFFCGFF